jgi:hypothetical protein
VTGMRAVGSSAPPTPTSPPSAVRRRKAAGEVTTALAERLQRNGSSAARRAGRGPPLRRCCTGEGSTRRRTAAQVRVPTHNLPGVDEIRGVHAGKPPSVHRGRRDRRVERTARRSSHNSTPGACNPTPDHASTSALVDTSNCESARAHRPPT